MAITFHTENIEFKLSEDQCYKKWIEQEISSRNLTVGEIAFIFCSNDFIREVNVKYLKHNNFTDVITFDYVEENVISGDIFISIDQVQENSYDYNVSFTEELNRVIIHGILHLIGFKDKDPVDKKMMRDAEDKALDNLKEMYDEN